MTDSIFAGSRSLTDDIPDRQAPQPSSVSAFATPADQARAASDHIKSTCAQPQPLPEPLVSPAVRQVREEARRLGIDFDREVARVLHRARGNGLGAAPSFLDGKPGPDPLRNISDFDRRMAEYAAAEHIRRYKLA